MNRRGMTLIEMLIVIGLIGLMAAMGIPRIGSAIAKQNVRSARAAVVSMHATARAAAIQRGIATSLVFDGNTLLVVSRHPVTGALDTVGEPQDFNRRYGVTVTTTADTLQFDARGLGTATTDTRIVVSRGVYADGIVINSLGRVLR